MDYSSALRSGQASQTVAGAACASGKPNQQHASLGRAPPFSPSTLAFPHLEKVHPPDFQITKCSQVVHKRINVLWARVTALLKVVWHQ